MFTKVHLISSLNKEDLMEYGEYYEKISIIGLNPITPINFRLYDGDYPVIGDGFHQ